MAERIRFAKDTDGICYVRRPTGERLNPRYCQKTIKYGGGGLMVWRWLIEQGVSDVSWPSQSPDVNPMVNL
ncbi:hypothetical protein Trydic_g16841 [Trypoxylus dichotomus]